MEGLELVSKHFCDLVVVNLIKSPALSGDHNPISSEEADAEAEVGF